MYVTLVDIDNRVYHIPHTSIVTFTLALVKTVNQQQILITGLDLTCVPLRGLLILYTILASQAFKVKPKSQPL